MMKNLTGAHCAKLQDSGVMQVRSTEQEKIGTLEKQVSDLERELNRYKVTNMLFITDGRGMCTSLCIRGAQGSLYIRRAQASVLH